MVQKQLNQHKSSLSGNPVNKLKVNNDNNTQNKRAVPFILSVRSQSQSVNKASISAATASPSLEGVHTQPLTDLTHLIKTQMVGKKRKKRMLHNTIILTPSLPQPVKFLGSKMHTYMPQNSICDGPTINLLSIRCILIEILSHAHAKKKKGGGGGGGGGNLMISNLPL